MPEAKGLKPVVGVGVVVFRGDAVLLIRRGRAPMKGQWSIPGGRVRYGERLADAALRELFEETAVRARITGLIDVFEAVPPPFPGASTGGPGAHFIMIDYVAEWVQGEPVAGDDAADAAFVSFPEAVGRLRWDETRRAVETALAIRGVASGAAPPAGRSFPTPQNG